jgi:hypothetical protein
VDKSKIDKHGDKMPDFYATQARGYAAVRENMLVARADMMSAFGPIKKGRLYGTPHGHLEQSGMYIHGIGYGRASYRLLRSITAATID